MLLAVVTYKPLFHQLLVIADTKNKVELVAKQEIKTISKPINAYSHDSIKIETVKSFYTDGSYTVDTKGQMVSVIRGNFFNLNLPVMKPVMQLGNSSYWQMVLIVFIMIFYVTMVYGPIAAFLVELFPTKIRYTSMSLPYHIGNGVFG